MARRESRDERRERIERMQREAAERREAATQAGLAPAPIQPKMTASRIISSMSFENKDMRPAAVASKPHAVHARRPILQQSAPDVQQADRPTAKARPVHLMDRYPQRTPPVTRPAGQPGRVAVTMQVRAADRDVGIGTQETSKPPQATNKRAELSAKSCRQENRPRSNRGDGSSRPFIPWCQKGK